MSSTALTGRWPGEKRVPLTTAESLTESLPRAGRTHPAAPAVEKTPAGEVEKLTSPGLEIPQTGRDFHFPRPGRLLL